MVEQQVVGHFFDHREIVIDLIKRQNLHEGRWKLTLELGLTGQTMSVKTPDGSLAFLPAGLVLVQRIGITRTKDINNLTVDAAEVNPQPRKREGGKRATKRARKK